MAPVGSRFSSVSIPDDKERFERCKRSLRHTSQTILWQESKITKTTFYVLISVWIFKKRYSLIHWQHNRWLFLSTPKMIITLNFSLWHGNNLTLLLDGYIQWTGQYFLNSVVYSKWTQRNLETWNLLSPPPFTASGLGVLVGVWDQACHPPHIWAVGINSHTHVYM